MGRRVWVKMEEVKGEGVDRGAKVEREDGNGEGHERGEWERIVNAM